MSDRSVYQWRFYRKVDTRTRRNAVVEMCIRDSNQTGSHRSIFLLLSGIFALYRRYHARCGKIYRANVCHACILVHHKNYIHHGYRAFYPENPGHLLGVPADLVNQFGDLFDLLLKS